MAKEPVERVRFPGSDSPIQPTREEKLTPPGQSESGDGSEDEEEATPPDYKREEIGARIGEDITSRGDVQKLSAELDEEDTVPLIFAKEVRLQDRGLMHTWKPGIHMVPVSIAGAGPKEMHWWLKHNKVKRAADPRKQK
jgi:hypothetical protein